MTEQEGKAYLSRKESAALLGISVRMLDRHADQGKLHRHRQGLRGIVFLKEEVEAFQRERTAVRPLEKDQEEKN